VELIDLTTGHQATVQPVSHNHIKSAQAFNGLPQNSY